MGKIAEALEKAEREHVPAEKPMDTSPGNPGIQEQAAPTLRDRKPGAASCRNGNGMDRKLVTYFSPHSLEAEQFRILRTKLLFPSSGKPPRCMMVTSAAEGEGKSLLACNLAVSIARNINEHVLLMDCDMRVPSVHRFFGLNNRQGLSEYLSLGAPIADLLVRTAIDRLSILQSGRPPKNPAELISSEKMKNLIQEVRNRYPDRYIIMDSPPPHLAAETNALAGQVDGIIVVLKCGATSRELAAELIGNLGKKRILGIVFNQYDSKTFNFFGNGKLGKYYSKPIYK